MEFDGAPFASGTGDLASDVIQAGDVQMTGEGTPYVLLTECQTMGGYPKVGTLFVLDAFLLAQQQAHTEVRFTQISLEEAQEKLRYFYRFFGV